MEKTYNEQIEALVNYIEIDTTNYKKFVQHGIIDAELGIKYAEKMKDIENKIDVTDYKKIIDTHSMKHILKRHGNVLSEAKSGQIAVLKEDFLLIPEISGVDNIISIEKSKLGLLCFTYKRSINNIDYFLVEEVQTGRKQLACKTLYKRRTK
jgi:hypothetical protein